MQGHLNPMLQFAKRLVSKGVEATLANTIAINKSMHFDPSCQIDIETISDGFDEGGSAQAESTEVYLQTFQVVGSQSLADLIKKLKDLGRPLTAVTYDGFLPWALDVAKQFELIGMAFSTQPWAVNNIYYHVQRGLLPIPLSKPTVSLPGLPLLQTAYFIIPFTKWKKRWWIGWLEGDD
ncbi:UDP-glucosyltransferase, putative [Ricinus communis]|uniref:UDP-glucosyltransferase, putative n=1 Tax=Ricinus communis TaxID=3988 RepID=B9T2H7_RICCO|nr:UDP-glucosyltransferase, putative [Ricinus communis]